MSAVEITGRHLQLIAGHVYARGADYLREGRVRTCHVTPDGALEGIVDGTETYQVRITATASELYASCSCPVRYELCKHAAALVLHHLRQLGEVAPAERVQGMFATRIELEEYVDQHQVRHALFVCADTLCPELPIAPHETWIRNVMSRMPMRDVASLDVARRHFHSRQLDQAIARAAQRFFHAAAEHVRDGLAEEATRTAPIAELVPLWTKLVGARRRVRERAVPRSRAFRATGAWSFDARACAIVWKERERVFRAREYSCTQVTARLVMPSGGEPQLSCSCDDGEAGCTHELALIDATFDVLGDPDRLEVARSLAEELMRPGWARALAELDRLDDAQAKQRAAIEVWWRIEDELGSLTVTPIVKKQLKRGGTSAGSRVSAGKLLDDYRDQLDDTDARIADYLASWTPGTRTVGTYPVRAFTALAGHPRVLYGDDRVELRRVPLGFAALPSQEHIRLEPTLEGARLSPRLLGPLLAAFAPGEPLFLYDDERGRAYLIEVGDEARALWNVLDKHGDVFPPESHVQLLDRLGRLEARMPLVVPQELKGTSIAATPTVVLRLRLLPDVALELETFVRPGPGAPLFSPGHGPRDVLLVRDGERGYVRRELSAELPLVRDRLATLPLDGAEEGPPNCFRLGDPNAALALVAALQDGAEAAGIEVDWIAERPQISRRVGVEALRVHVERKRDWFGIVGDIKHEAGRLELAVLLDAARRQQRFVRVDDRRWLELTEALQKKLRDVADRTFVGKQRLELSPGAVPAITALAEAGAKVEVAEDWKALADRLASSRALRPKPPAALHGTLRDYQIAGHAWLTHVAAWGAGACLADDMGLGKTIQAISVLLDRAKHGPALVLAPTSVAYNWVNELQRFAPSLRPILYVEQTERAQSLAQLGKRDVLIATYGLLVRDAAQLAGVAWGTLVVDEAQALKNPTTQRAKAARALDAKFRIAMTGTPLENHLGELWSLFAVVFPGLLGSWEQFRERFAIPIERTKDPDARAALARVLAPFLLRRTKQEVARELPARTEIEVPVALSDDEKALYEDARLAAVAELGVKGAGIRDEQRRFQVLAALTRLRLLASHPRLYDPTSKVPSSKLARALELLEELREEGHRALVFSQFTSHLAIVRDALDEAGISYLYLDGATPAGQRGKLVERFQRGEADVFLISLKAGGTGINLTAADYVLHLDPWWNPAVEDQATDRAHRIGQTKPVTVYRLIGRGTIEEQIVKLHHDKRALVAGILEGSDAAAKLTTRDLLALLQAAQ